MLPSSFGKDKVEINDISHIKSDQNTNNNKEVKITSENKKKKKQKEKEEKNEKDTLQYQNKLFEEEKVEEN